ncbi:MAG: membrane protein [Acidimicrobiia bacterium]|nr:MAG: membrane protein [Acidimicrobiia bacterium]
MTEVRVSRASDLPPERPPSTWAVGWITFAAAMMIMIGTFHVIAGLVALFDDEFFVVTREYVFQLDATQWGWIHLILGVIIAVSGGYLLTGSVFARTIGVILALLSALAGFAWLPWYPVWGVVIIAIAVSVIWALTAHGRDIVAGE